MYCHYQQIFFYWGQNATQQEGGRKLLNQVQVLLTTMKSDKLNHASGEAGRLSSSLYMTYLSFSSGNPFNFKTQKQCSVMNIWRSGILMPRYYQKASEIWNIGMWQCKNSSHKPIDSWPSLKLLCLNKEQKKLQKTPNTYAKEIQYETFTC